MLVWVRGKVEQKRSLTFYVFGHIRSKCSSSSTFPKSQLRQSLFVYGMPFHAFSTTSSCVLPHRNWAKAFRSWTVDVIQISFAFVRHTLEAQVSYLHVGPNLTVGKELFNES